MKPLNEQAYNYLQNLIMENHFSYQEVYSETKLSKSSEYPEPLSGMPCTDLHRRDILILFQAKDSCCIK